MQALNHVPCVLVVMAALSTPAFAQMTQAEVIAGAVRQRDQADEQRRSDQFNQQYNQQLLRQLQGKAADHSPGNDPYQRIYDDAHGDYDHEANRYRGQEQYRAVPANPAAAAAPIREDHWADVNRQVRQAQPYGDRGLTKQSTNAEFGIDQFDAADLQSMLDRDGVIDVNRLPDTPPPPAPSAAFDFTKLGPCCPTQSGWMRAVNFCQHGYWEDRDGDGRKEQYIELYNEGQIDPGSGQCRVGAKVRQ